MTRAGVGMNVMELERKEDFNYISFLFRNLAKQNSIPVLVYFEGMKTNADLYFNNRKGDRLFLQFQNDTFLPNSIQTVDLSLIIKDELFAFKTKLIGYLDDYVNCFEIEKPSIAYSALRRLVTRYKIPSNKREYLTLTDHGIRCPIIDISTKGLSFLCSEKIFQNGDIIRNVNIQLSTGDIWTDGKIHIYQKTINDLPIYGMVFLNTDWLFFLTVFSFIFQNKYPCLKPIMDFPIEEIYCLFEESGYLDLKPRKQMNSNFTKVYDNYNKLKNVPQITAGYVFSPEGKPLSTGSVLRIYNQTFLGHQLAASTEARFNLKSKTDIYEGITEFLLNNPYFQYYLTYFDASSQWHNGMYKKICDLVNNKEKLMLDTLEYFEVTINELTNQKNISDYNCCVLDDPSEFITFCIDNLDPIICKCYAYSSREDFFLNEVKVTYEALGLFVNRRLWCIEKHSKKVAFAVTEVFSDGLNLYNLLDMCRLYISDPEIDLSYAIQSLLPQIALFYKRYQKSNFNLLIKSNQLNYSISSICIKGVDYSHLFGRVISNRDGGSEYIKLIKK